MLIEDMPSGYAKVLDYVLSVGEKRCSRGLSHREITGFQLQVSRPERSLATNVGRKLNTKIAYVEALQLIAGESYPNLLNQVSNDSFRRFMNGQVFHGAYGPRIRPQMPSVISRLHDTDSRQAIVQVWDPMYDNQARQDLPCTLSFQFLLRDDELRMVTTMRSNDAWLGLPYDVFQFAQLQCTLAAVLDVAPGLYTHNVGSMHLYETDLDKIEDVRSRTTSVEDEFWGMSETMDWWDSKPLARWETAQRTANVILDGEFCSLVLADGLPSKAWDHIHA